VDSKNTNNIFPSPRALNFVKNQWIETKLKLYLYLGMVKQNTKYQMNLSNLVKGQWIKTKLELDLHHGMAKQSAKYQMNI
jgi:hypothetical protein